ncbi:MAG: outer membrane protein assembly factor BamE, partial [Gammaproteobacteria bacterium]|nr:outer membrane protein assembly factor BamE [Gammaproteobacteria bacterium]
PYALPAGFDSTILRVSTKNSMRIKLSLLVFLSAMLLVSGCIYQAALSQGNLLDQEDIDQVEVGMTRGQVRFLLGTPMIDDPFHENRWDYIYYLRVGRQKAVFKRWVSVYFEGENVSEVIRDQELRPDL